MAAVLACGPARALSHRPGGALWEFGLRWPTLIDVTAPSKRRHAGHPRAPLAHPHRRDVTRHYGIPVTTLARTLLDLAEVLDTPSLTRAVNEARLRRKATLTDLPSSSTAHPAERPKAPPVRRERRPAPPAPRFEDEFLRFVNRHGLPTPEVNQIVAGYEVDMLWREQRLVVELDGREFHEHPFEADRERDAALLNAGFSVLR